MHKKINVLVYPCGSENGIEIHRALKDVVNIKIFGASGKEDHGIYIYKNYFGGIPYIQDSRFVEYFNNIIIKNEIDIVIPTHDDITVFLATNQKMINAKIAVPGIDQAEICRSKRKTYNLFKGESFCPKTFSNLNQIHDFPIFAKPDRGQGGKGSFLILDKCPLDEKKLNNLLKKDYVLTEYLNGEESTVDCFTDRYGKLRFIGPRVRNRIFGGISVNSSTQELTDEIKSIAIKINEKIKMRGLWYFQIKKDRNDKYKLLEISIRTAGSMCLYRGLGVNFPLLTIYDHMDIDLEILCNDYSLIVDRALCNKYRSNFFYDTIYIDLDDTIIKNGLVNYQVISFLYNAKNHKKDIILLTKHILDLDNTLHSLAIHKGLFNEIIQLREDDLKFNRIKRKIRAVFIDNSFKERSLVAKNIKIPVFDVDAIETLIDWQE